MSVHADCHYSSLRLLTADGAPVDLGTWHACRQYFRDIDDDRLWVMFEQDLLPGYVWIFPLGDGRANVGLGVLREGSRKGASLAALWRDVVTRPRLRDVLGRSAVAEGPHRAWPIPASWDERALGSGRVLFAGDAAAVVDPLTGEGIAQALE